MHNLRIIFIHDKHKKSDYFLNAIKNVKKYFNEIKIEYMQMNNNMAIHDKWIIVILNNIDLDSINQNFVNNFDKTFAIFIYLAEEYNDLTVNDAYEKEFDYVINMKLTSHLNFSLFLRNVISKRLEIKLKNQKIIVGNLITDIVSKKVWIDGHRLFLTKKEFDLLIILLKTPNTYIDSNDIFQKVWGTNDYDRTRSVSQYIHRLRIKIGQEYIGSDTNLGYMFIPKII